ncbi:MAG: hypothetical protein ACR2Q4_10210 [Geminicoccaceae bacterium]
MTKQSGTGATLSSFLLALGLVGVIAFELSDGFPLSPSVTAAPMRATSGASAVSEVPSLALPLRATVDEITKRPLFSASRRPLDPVVEAPSEPVNEVVQTLSLRLVGTMVTGTQRVALLLHPEQGLVRLRTRQKIDGWQLETIDQNRVSLQQGDDVTWLTLQPEEGAPNAQPPTAPKIGTGVGWTKPGLAKTAPPVSESAN